MSKIKKFSDFIASIYEVNTVGTYIDSNLFKKDSKKSLKYEVSPTRQHYGKIFAQAPSTADKTWGITFEPINNFFYRVNFSEEFEKNFNLKNSYQIDFDDLRRVEIQRETKFNRIHFPDPYSVPTNFRGIGLGYVIYEAFIKMLGFGCSESEDSTPEAQKIWSQIANDPDFHVVVIDSMQTKGAVFALHKDCKKENIDKLIEEWIVQKTESLSVDRVIIDEVLLEKYPSLKKFQNE